MGSEVLEVGGTRRDGPDDEPPRRERSRLATWAHDKAQHWGRSGQLRRFLAGLAAVAVAAAAFANLRDATPDPPSASRTTSRVPAVSTWPLRGDLAEQLGTDLLGGGAAREEARRLVDANPGSRLLYAGRVGRRTVLLAALAPSPGIAGIPAVADVREGTGTWSQSALSSLSSLSQTTEGGAPIGDPPFWFADFPDTADSADSAYVADGELSDVLLVGPPRPVAAELSTSLVFARSGAASRVWQRTEGRDGTVAITVHKRVGVGLRARLVRPQGAALDLPVSADAFAGTPPDRRVTFTGMKAATDLDAYSFPLVIGSAVRRMVAGFPGTVTARVAWTGRSAMSYVAAVMAHSDLGVDAQIWVAWRPPFDVRAESQPEVGMRLLPTGTTTAQPFLFFGPGDSIDSRRHWTYVDPSGRAGWLRSGRFDTQPAQDSDSPGVLVEVPAAECRDDPRACPLLVRTSAGGAVLHRGPVGDLLGTVLP